jgi:hypothetical protein
VQPDWLHEFLLDPHMIRPATVLRMPKFNMTPEEATRLVDYFAAVDGAEYPYEFDPRTRDSRLDRLLSAEPARLDNALKIVTSVCVKCHSVGDYVVSGAATSFGTNKVAAPDLARVYPRLRPDWLKPWISNPKKLLPYTGMPSNILVTQPLDQALFPGTSEEQIDGVVDLLANFDRYAKSKTSIKPLVSAEAAAPPVP